MDNEDDEDLGGSGGLRGTLGIVAAPAFAVVAASLVEPVRAPVAALFAVAATLWLSEAIHPAATALVVVALAPLLGACTTKDAFAALGNPILYLFVGSFMIAEAMRVHGLGERLAHALARRARGRLSALMATSGAAFLISMWISNAAATAVVLPVALSLARRVDDARYRAATVLAIAWAASMGGLCTPVGTPPNLIGMRAVRELGLALDFVGWMKIATPIAACMLIAMWVVLAWHFGVRVGQPAPHAAQEPSSWSRGEIASCAAFALAVVGWTVPGLLEAFGHPSASILRARMPEEVVALLCAGVLFVWPIQQRGAAPRRALSWRDAARIDWGTVLLFGGGILLGDLANRSGLAAVWGQALMEMSGAHSVVVVVSVVTVVSVLLSEIASNTAAATLMIPLSIGMAQAAHVPALPAVLGATLGASFGFMMPISTAPNAMAYATGEVRVPDMMKAGVVFDVIGSVVVVVALLLVWH